MSEPTVQPQLLTSKQAAEFLAMKEITLRKARMNGASAGKIPPPPCIRLGRTIRYDRDDLRRYIEQHRDMSGQRLPDAKP